MVSAKKFVKKTVKATVAVSTLGGSIVAEKAAKKAIGKIKGDKGQPSVPSNNEGAVAKKVVKKVDGGRAEVRAVSAQADDMGLYEFDQQVAGESHYQKALAKAVGRKRDKDGSYWRGVAESRHDRKNKHDKWAVGVYIESRLVGYLPASAGNKRIVEELRRGSRTVPARIKGGFKMEDGSRAYYGVELAL